MQTDDAYNTNNAVPTDRGLNVQTDRNLMDSPDPRRRAYAKQTSDVPLNNNEEKVADNRQWHPVAIKNGPLWICILTATS